ncbi:cation:proton antiporter [Parvibaculum sp.]|uniref:cation:proton antiporter domain-containing protein n=1 Tax=Parvibaculum sp. TaxID=2024848 RepID=UPI002732E22F|nr:cation:proton antiporter [Parvibaculum sp.]MDP3329661.1 cation:proton antiporter [Parvibaculum sp.]
MAQDSAAPRVYMRYSSGGLPRGEAEVQGEVWAAEAAVDAVTGGVHVPYLREVIVFLIAAVAVMPLFHWFRASTVLGYLFIGALIGPHGLKLIAEGVGLSEIGELGVVFLLFTIGLELSWQRLRSMRTYVLGLGGAQVLLCGLALAGIFLLMGLSAPAATIIGFALALSSTAIVTQLLIERGEFAAQPGRIAFSILLMQDLAVVPILVMVSIFSAYAQGGEGVNIFALAGLATLKAAVAVLLILTVGRYILRWIYGVVARTGNPELFLALSLLAALLTAVATGAAGLSMALGAFLAGLLLSDTEFRPQVETDIQPFKSLLLGLFFISVGLGMDFTVFRDNFVAVLGLIAIFIALKTVLIGLLTFAFGEARLCSLRTGLLLASGGEFAFVVISASAAGGVVPLQVAHIVQLAAAISMALTPGLATLGAWLQTRFDGMEGDRERNADALVEGLDAHVIIAGYGRVGRMIGRLLREQQLPFVALDLDPARARAARTRGELVYYGDAARAEVLERVGIAKASAVVVTLDNSAAASHLVRALRAKWPKIPIFARARDREHMLELEAAGASAVVHEALEASLQLSGHVLRAIGAPSDAATTLIERVRTEVYERQIKAEND